MPGQGVRESARKARRKPAALGPDIDLSAYSLRAERHAKIRSLRELPPEAREKAMSVGVDAGEECRAGSFFQSDHSVVLAEAHESGLEVMDITGALAKYGWLSAYWWGILGPGTDKYTAQAELRQTRGYFLRALPGARSTFPLQACLYMSREGTAQNVHNVIIAEEGSELTIITGCASAPPVRTGLHVGVSEFYVKKNARLFFTMVHNWAEGMAVRPRSAAVVEEGGVFVSNYLSLRPVATLQMYPVVRLTGRDATARFQSVLLAPPGTRLDVGARVFLSAPGGRAEVLSRAVSRGGEITARGHLIGEAPGVKAHLECRGLILSEEGAIHAVPELEGRVGGVDLSHEAAVGKIAQEEIRYLMARGIGEEEAAAAIVRGFLDVEIKGLPDSLREEMKKAVSEGPGRAM